MIMKKYLLISLILLFSASNLLAQDGETLEYKTYKVEKDGFSLDVPKAFDLVYFDKDEDKYRFYGYYSPETYLFVDSRETTKDLLNKGLIEYATDNGAKVRHLSVENFDADKYEFLDKEGFYQIIIIVPNKNRNLVFHSVSTLQNDPSVKRFFSSLKFDNLKIPQILASQFFNGTIEISKPENDKNILVPIVNSGIKSGSGSGSGSGAGSGGSGIGNGRTTKQPDDKPTTGETAGLKLLSKPRPPYTDMARFYNMQGTVLLRVTFLANGKIGSVSVVEKTPFGLTLSAINAAKLMQFEPARRNGVAYSVTKTVQFSFTIY
jgi:TonB family protein